MSLAADRLEAGSVLNPAILRDVTMFARSFSEEFHHPKEERLIRSKESSGRANIRNYSNWRQDWNTRCEGKLQMKDVADLFAARV